MRASAKASMREKGTTLGLPFALFYHVTCLFLVACPVGTSYDQTSLKCVPCGKGSYQDKEGQAICIECDKGTSTDNLGAVSSEECVKG